jgi:hypothetical protein
VMLCMVILLCTAAGCINFGAMMPGSGQGEGGSGGSGSGSGGGGGYGGGGGPGGGGGLPPGGGEIPLSDMKTTPMYTYFTVNCHYYSKDATDDHTRSIEDATVTGEIPIEMIREYNDLGMKSWTSYGTGIELRYTYQEFCRPDDQFCKPCKTTYEGPILGSASIQRAPSGGAKDWMAKISPLSPAEYNRWCSNFDPNGIYCPPRYPLSSNTAEIRITIPPVQDTCYPGASPELLHEMIGEPPCGITDAPFVLQDGEVITQKLKYDIVENSYASVDATYTFHISAR